MRKFFLISMMVIAVLAAGVSAIFAQEDPATAEPAASSAWLGISVSEVDGQLVIRRVRSDSPAEAAALQEGDIIVSFNGTAVATSAELSDLVEASAPGDSATLEIVRDEETLEIEVTLVSKPGRPGRDLELPEDALSAVEILLYVDLQEAEGSFEVVNVFAGRNPLDLQEGDVITSLNEQAVANLDVAALAIALSEDSSITVVVTRDGEEVTLEGNVFGGRGGRGGHHGDRGGRDGRSDDAQANPDENIEPSETPESGSSTYNPGAAL